MSTRSPTALYMAMLYCLRSSFGPQKTKFESSTCIIKNVSDNENINLKMASFLWQGNLPNWENKIKRLLVKLNLCLSPLPIIYFLSYPFFHLRIFAIQYYTLICVTFKYIKSKFLAGALHGSRSYLAFSHLRFISYFFLCNYYS
jgi:hypothetical protein